MTEEETSTINAEARWDEKMKEMDHTGDTLGMKIDDGIKEIVVALNLLGFHTFASCEGHVNDADGRGLPYPWIDITVPGKPERRYENEDKILEKTADEFNMSVSDMKKGTRADSEKALEMAEQRLWKDSETPAYQVWEKKNAELQFKVKPIVDEFNVRRDVPDDERIRVDSRSDAVRIHNGPLYKNRDPDDVHQLWMQRVRNKEVSQEETTELRKDLMLRQDEMKEFADFLKKKLLNPRKK